MNSCYGARYSSGPYSKYDQIASRKEEEERDQLLQKVRELEEENRALKEALTWACNRLHQWSPWNNGCHFKACGACPLKGYTKEESE